MPVKGFVDPDRHRPCFRCRKWFEPDEGSAQNVGSTSGASAALNTIGAFLPFPFRFGEKRFVCYNCQRKRRRFQWILYTTFALVILLVLILNALKII